MELQHFIYFLEPSFVYSYRASARKCSWNILIYVENSAPHPLKSQDYAHKHCSFHCVCVQNIGRYPHVAIYLPTYILQ